MRKIGIVSILALFISSFTIAAEVNVFNARHYKADAEIYSKFESKTGIKVNLINGKAKALEKRMESPAIKQRIKRLSKRMFKDVRKKEVMRKKG